MSKVHKRRRSRRRVAARRRLLTGLVLFVLALAAAIYLGAARYLPALEPVPLSAALEPAELETVPALARATFERETYPYSVIDGGASSVDELKNRMARDPVVAAHYADFAIDRTRVERLNQSRLAHVSYRIGNSVFWTRKPVVIKAGEKVLTDGLHVARTRCGNQLADKPGDVSPLEPAPGAMDVPLKSGPAASSPLALLHPPTSLPTALAGQSPGGMSLPSSGETAGGFGSSPLGGVGQIVGPVGDSHAPENTSSPSDKPATTADPPPDTSTPPTTPRPTPSEVPGPTPPVQPELPPVATGTPDPGKPPLIPPEHLPIPPGTDPPLPPGLIDPADPGDPEQPTSVPEPGTALLLIVGGVTYALRRLHGAGRD